MKYASIILALLLFEPIIIDEPTMNQILQAAHQNMRGTESDWMKALFDSLERNAVDRKAAEERAAHPRAKPLESNPVPAEPEK